MPDKKRSFASGDVRSSPEPRHVSESRAEFSGTFAKHGMSLAALQYGSDKSQIDRFKVLAEIGDLSGKSVLDVGCGFAHLADYLETKYPGVCYTGIELVGDIAASARKRRPGLEILDGAMESLPASRRWDYVMQSGVFNIECYDFAAAETMVRAMFDHATLAIAANFLSRLSTSAYSSRSAYYDAADVAILASKLSRRFSILHHYRDNDFTLYLWKDPQHPGLETLAGDIPLTGIRRPTV